MAIKKELKIEEVKPTMTRMVTTADRYTEIDLTNEFGLIVSPEMIGIIKPVQTVIAIGESPRGIKKGDLVFLDFERYKVFKTSRVAKGMDERDEFHKDTLQFEIPTVEINDTPYLMLDCADVTFVIEKYHYDEFEVNLKGIKEAPKPIEELHQKYSKAPMILSAGANLDLSKVQDVNNSLVK